MKTRAWDGERWRTDYVVMPDGDVWATEEGLFYPCLPIYKTDWKLSRFTGLLDKNKNEIYEHHIVKAWNCYGPGGNHQNIYSVEIGAFGCNLEAWTFQDDETRPEIIGDVFLNPELIEV